MSGFAPRRLTHVNLWVSDLERAIPFFEQTCGIQLVRRERDLIAGFHSNGNTHHDLGLLEMSKGFDRVGRDGAIQIPKSRGTQAGLNHLGWEMEDEIQLVEVYKRLKDQGIATPRLSDHVISHSVYVVDPDGNMHEFYADAIPDWRTVFNLEHEDLVTSVWDPAVTPPSAARYFPVDPDISYVADAPLSPMMLTSVALDTSRFDEMVAFFTDVGGLRLELVDAKPRRALFRGRCGRPDMTLTEVEPGAPTGLRTFSFILDPETEFDRAVAGVETRVAGAHVVDDQDRRALVLDEPDGLFKVEFYLPKAGQPLPSLRV